MGNHMVLSAIWNKFERVGFQRVQNCTSQPVGRVQFELFENPLVEIYSKLHETNHMISYLQQFLNLYYQISKACIQNSGTKFIPRLENYFEDASKEGSGPYNYCKNKKVSNCIPLGYNIKLLFQYTYVYLCFLLTRETRTVRRVSGTTQKLIKMNTLSRLCFTLLEALFYISLFQDVGISRENKYS